jgi:hypothetical protein
VLRLPLCFCALLWLRLSIQVVASGLVDSDLLMEALLHHAAPRQAIDSPMLNPRFRQRKAPSIGRLQWSVQHSSRRIAIQDLDAVGAMEDSDTWRCLVSDMVFDSSSTRFNGSGEQHYWEVEITNTAECNVMIGVCRPDAKVAETGAYTTRKGWCYFARDGKIYHHNEPKAFGKYNNPAQSGDRIGIMLNEEVRACVCCARVCVLCVRVPLLLAAPPNAATPNVILGALSPKLRSVVLSGSHLRLRLHLHSVWVRACVCVRVCSGF